MTNTLHAHVSRVSRDCDSTYSDSYVVEFNENEIAEQVRAYFNGFVNGEPEAMWNDFSDIHFMNRVFANEAGPYAVLRARITIDEDGFDYDEDTEEGFTSKEVRWCKGESCDTSKRTHRDSTAESMGF